MTDYPEYRFDIRRGTVMVSLSSSLPLGDGDGLWAFLHDDQQEESDTILWCDYRVNEEYDDDDEFDDDEYEDTDYE